MKKKSCSLYALSQANTAVCTVTLPRTCGKKFLLGEAKKMSVLPAYLMAARTNRINSDVNHKKEVVWLFT